MQLAYDRVVEVISKAIAKYPKSAKPLSEVLNEITNVHRTAVSNSRAGRPRSYPWEIINLALRPTDLAKIWGMYPNHVTNWRARYRLDNKLPKKLYPGTAEYIAAFEAEKKKAEQFRSQVSE